MNKERLKEQLISEILLLPPTAIDYHTSEHLRHIFPDKALVEGEMGIFNVEIYTRAGLCTLTRKTFLYNQMSIYWQGPEQQVMQMHRQMIRGRRGGVSYSGMDLISSSEIGGEGEIGDAGIKTNKFSRISKTRRSITSFYAAISSKRYARISPCVLVLEDLDSLITPQNRSFFLNELDGFAANIGIVTLATTNHPERLDVAILERPSRFDRKYPFDLPQLTERRAYIAL